MREIASFIFKSILVAVAILSCLVLYGLISNRTQTIDTLGTVLHVSIVVFFVVLFIVIAILSYRSYMKHKQRASEIRLVNAQSRELESKSRYIETDTSYKRMETSLLPTRVTTELNIAVSRAMAEIEALRTQTQINLQQSRIIKAHMSESMYYVEGTQFTQLQQGMPVHQIARVRPELRLEQPYAPTFQEMHSLIRGESELVLGYTSTEPVMGTLEDHLLSMLSTGRPKTGKSVALMYYCAMFLKVGVLPIVFDPQNSLQELDGILPYAGSLKSIHEMIPLVYKDLLEREELWSHGRNLKPYSLVLMVDEFPMIVDYEDTQGIGERGSIARLVRRLILEYRKMHAYTIVAGQGFPADMLPTLSRENTSSRLIFPTSDRYAKMAGLDDKHRKTLLPMIQRAEKGTAILDCSVMEEPLIINIPYTTVEDLEPLVLANPLYSQLVKKFSLSTNGHEYSHRDTTRQHGSDTDGYPIIDAQYREIEPGASIYLPQAFHNQSEKLRGRYLAVYNAYRELGTTSKVAIARATGIHESTVYRCIKELKQKGYIQEY